MSIEKKEHLNTEVRFCDDPDYAKFTKNDDAFVSWCNFMRECKGFDISESDIVERLGVSGNWVRTVIRPKVHWFRGKATYDKGSSSIFYNRDDLNKYLLDESAFSLRTIYVDLTDSSLNIRQDVLNRLKSFEEFNSKEKSSTKYKDKDFQTRLRYLQAKMHLYTAAANVHQRCDPADISSQEIIKAFTGSESGNTEDSVFDFWGSADIYIRDKNTRDEVFEQEMYEKGCIRVAIGGYDSSSKSKKKIYIENPMGKKGPHRVSYREWMDFIKDKTLTTDTVSETETENETEESIAEPKLSSKQQELIDLIVSGKENNIFITGGAGTGKSFLLMEAIKALENAGKKVLVTASSAIAARNIDGRTLHSAFKINPKEEISVDTIGNENPSEEIIYADAIVIDEISMVRMDLFKYVIKTIERAEEIRFERAKKSNPDAVKKYKTCVFMGDFFQLSPIVIASEMESMLDNGWNMDALQGGGYCFFTKEWKERIKSVEQFHQLNEVFRQQGDLKFQSVLEVIRTGESEHSVKEAIKWLNKNSSKSYADDNITALCPRKEDCNSINEYNLYEEKGMVCEFRWQAFDDDDNKIKELSNNEYPVLALTKGAKVLTTVNNYSKGYINGSEGIVEFVSEDSDVVKVRLTSNNKRVTIHRHVYSADASLIEDNREISKIKQFPLILGYAMTIHRTQGVTLEKARIFEGMFAEGQLYVALSRVKSIEGLYLANRLAYRYVEVNKYVQKLYFPERYPDVEIPDAEALERPDSNQRKMLRRLRVLKQVAGNMEYYASIDSDEEESAQLEEFQKSLDGLKKYYEGKIKPEKEE